MHDLGMQVAFLHQIPFCRPNPGERENPATKLNVFTGRNVRGRGDGLYSPQNAHQCIRYIGTDQYVKWRKYRVLIAIEWLARFPRAFRMPGAPFRVPTSDEVWMPVDAARFSVCTTKVRYIGET
jgi:hypothetical protein